MRKRKITAIALTSAVLITSIFPSGIVENTSVNHIVEAQETKKTETENSWQPAGEEGNSEEQKVYSDEEIDYEYIIEESRDAEYRGNVEISEGSVLLVSNLPESEVEHADWYKEIGASEKKLMNEHEEDGTTSYTYEITVETEDIWGVIDKLNENRDEGVIIAEPDYIYHLQEDGVPTEVSDEGMGDEWYLNDLNVNETWKELKEEGKSAGENVVVAVIDTGVDYMHNDLIHNMWVNTAEVTGAAGVDDDGNGYVDDVHGISLIDDSGNPADDHGHGTHVAGIIAMSAGNGGGVGIAYQSQIMAIKAGQADGSFASSDIAEAIRYAMANGADVINMSFGGYGHSAVVEATLQDAFGKCVLVAAAGNDGYPTLDATPAFYLKGNMYPAAYSYVVGVMAYDQNGQLAEFSNWDYKANFGAEYEIVAPGQNIYSTLPGNRYASWSGTSMATPMVSAVAALIRSEYTDKNAYNSRFIMGQLVSATTDSLLYVDKEGKKHSYAKLNVANSLNNMPKPNITVQEMYLFDSPELSETNNGDGVIQAGEVVDIGVILRNQWGAATDFKVNISATSAGGVENPYVEFLSEKEVALKDIGTFSTQDNGLVKDEEGSVVGVDNPIRIRIAADAPNDASITLKVNYTAKNQMDAEDTTVYTYPKDKEYIYTFTVQKGKALKGKITEDTVLTKDQYWIIENAVLIPKGVTVSVEPGTQIQFWSSDSNSVYAEQNMAYIQVEGTLNIEGSQEEPVELFPGKGYEQYAVDLRQEGNGKTTIQYANIVNPKLKFDTGSHLNITQNDDWIYYRDLSDGKITLTERSGYVVAKKISNSKISNLRGEYDYTSATCNFEADTVLFDNCHIGFSNMRSTDSVYLVNKASVDIWEGVVYRKSAISKAGFGFYIPEYEVSQVYEYDGYKYAVMKLDSNEYFLNSEWVGDKYVTHEAENKKLLVDAIKKNGGTLGSITYDNYPLLDMMAKDEKVKEMMGENVCLCILTSLEYDEYKQGVVDESGELIDISQYYNVGMANKTYPYETLTAYLNDNNEAQIYHPSTGEVISNIYSHYDTTSYLQPCVLVKYPATVSDEKIQNVYFGSEGIEMESYQTFYNNAILNCLTEKDPSAWMRFTTNSLNNKAYYIGNNYWGTTSEILIDRQIMDFDDIISLADYIETPYLTTGNEDMYPFVTDIYITDKKNQKVTSIGNGTYEVHVVFNRDMDTTVSPYVTYGPDEPYTDYVVEGAFVSAREWVGTMTVNVIINQGTQCFRVKDAQAAEDAWLTTGTDWGRFDFNIEASGAEALTLHGEGGTNQVALNWIQDDYETLAGYNLYRSEIYDKNAEYPLDGFTKINSTLIGAGTSEYVDTEVLPGKTYYYYFKVVDTAMAESKASNVIACTTVDNVLPVITHSVITEANAGLGLTVKANVTDNIGVAYVKVHYKEKSASAWNSRMMSSTMGSSYFVTIPANELKQGEMLYYIEASDGTASAFAGTEEAPNTFWVKEITTITSVTPDSLDVSESGQTGTVNGLYFTDGMQVYVGGIAVDTQYVSDKKLTFTLPELDLGKKDVSIYKDGVEVAKYAKAIAYKDKSIKVYTNTVEGITETWINIPLKTNFEGKLESMEIVLSGNIYHSAGNGKTEYSEKYQNYITTYIMSSDTGMTDLGELSVYPYYKEEMQQYKLIAVKINGVEVTNLEFGDIQIYEREEIVPIDSITLQKKEIKLGIGETLQLEADVFPVNASIKTLNWTTANSCVQVTSDGCITGISEGTGYIQCETKDGSDKFEVITVIVTGEPLESIQLEKTDITMMVGESLTLNVLFAPLNAGLSHVSWETSGSVISVNEFDTNNGIITFQARKEGNETLRIYDSRDNSLEAVCSIKVVKNEAYPQLNENIITLSENEKYQATAVIKNAVTEGSRTCSWTSSNISVAKVDSDGMITMVGEGVAVITATLDENGRKAQMIVLCGNGTAVVGDINGDGVINVQDAMLSLQLVSSSKLNTEYLRRADVNGDGIVSSVDAMMILQYTTGKINSFEK